MKTSVVATIVLASALAGCSSSQPTAPGTLLFDPTQMETLLLRVEPIGDLTSAGLTLFERSGVGFASIVQEVAFKSSAAKDNSRDIDFIVVLHPTTSIANNGAIQFANPAYFDANYSTWVRLGWSSYSDGPQFIRLLRSKRVDPGTGAYYALNEEEFDRVIAPIQIKEIIDHSLRNGSEKRATFDAPYLGERVDGIQFVGVYDTKGLPCIIKIAPGESVFGMNMTIKRAYATK
jgi:hypothetical protein